MASIYPNYQDPEPAAHPPDPLGAGSAKILVFVQDGWRGHGPPSGYVYDR